MANLLYTKEAQARTILCSFRHKKRLLSAHKRRFLFDHYKYSMSYE